MRCACLRSAGAAQVRDVPLAEFLVNSLKIKDQPSVDDIQQLNFLFTHMHVHLRRPEVTALLAFVLQHGHAAMRPFHLTPEIHPLKDHLPEEGLLCSRADPARPDLLLLGLSAVPALSHDALRDPVRTLLRRSGMSVMVGASGIGKTRTLLEALSWTYGLYFEAPLGEAAAAEVRGGSTDMAVVAESLDKSYTPTGDIGQYRRHHGNVATNALRLCIILRLLLLQRMEELSTETTGINPHKWLVVQLLLCGYQSPVDQLSTVTQFRQLIQTLMTPMVAILARLDRDDSVRTQVKHELYNWPVRFVLQNKWTRPRTTQAASSMQSPTVSPNLHFPPFLVVVDEAQTLLGWETTHYSPVSEMSPTKPEGRSSTSPDPSTLQAPPQSPSRPTESSSSHLHPSTPTTPAMQPIPANPQRSLFSMLVRCLDSYSFEPTLASCVSGSSLTLLDRIESFSSLMKDKREFAVEGPPLRSVDEQVEYIESILRNLPDTVSRELKQLVYLRGRCRFAANLVDLLLTEPLKSMDLLERLRQCSKLLKDDSELTVTFVRKLRSHPHLVDACQHLYMGYMFNGGQMEVSKFEGRDIDILKWGLVPVNDLRGGVDGDVSGKVELTEPLMILAVEAGLKMARKHLTVDALICWYIKKLNLADAGGKLFETLIGYNLQRVLKDPAQRNKLFEKIVHPIGDALDITHARANQEAVRYAQSIHFNQGFCSYIDCSRTTQPLIDARQEHPPVGDEFQVFFPSTQEGADVVCFGTAPDRKEIAIIAQSKLYAVPVDDVVAQNAIKSTRPEKLGLLHHHPSIRILYMWPSSKPLASLFNVMNKAAEYIKDDYFILLHEEDMALFWSDPNTAGELDTFKRPPVVPKAGLKRPHPSTEE
jgi:hypothetical protein